MKLARLNCCVIYQNLDLAPIFVKDIFRKFIYLDFSSFHLKFSREITNVKGMIKCKNTFIVVGEIYLLPLMTRMRSIEVRKSVKNLIRDNKLMSIYLTSKLPRKMQLTKIVC